MTAFEGLKKMFVFHVFFSCTSPGVQPFMKISIFFDPPRKKNSKSFPKQMLTVMFFLGGSAIPCCVEDRRQSGGQASPTNQTTHKSLGTSLGAGNSKYFLIFTPIWEDSHFDEHIFWMGCFNRQLEVVCAFVIRFG